MHAPRPSSDTAAVRADAPGDPAPVLDGESTLHRLKFLISPRWIALEIAVTLFVLACYFVLAPWQFHRSSEHDARQAEIAAAVAASPVDLAQLMSVDQAPAASSRWRMVTATGHFSQAPPSYVRSRHDNDGNPAYEVLAPFITNAGVTILTDRGYIPYTSVQENKTSMPPLPSGTVTIMGRVQPDQIDPRHRPAITTPDGHRAYTAASSSILAGESGPVYQGFLELDGHSPGVIEAIALPQDNSRPFFSYAIQWLSFGAIAVFGLGYFAYREYHDPSDGEIYISDPGADDDDVPPRRIPPAKVSPSDDDAETVSPGSRRSRRARFDKSQLYD